jgi:hypothetical protein
MTKVIELQAGRIMQKSDLVAMDPAKMTEFMAEISVSGKPIRFVDSIPYFFSTKNVLACVDEVDVESLKLIAEHREMVITDEEYELMSRMKVLKASLIARIETSKMDYPFAKVPDGWSVETSLHISKTTVNRVRNDYTITIKTLEKIWNMASKQWAGDETATARMNINASGYSRTAVVGKNKIDIGCQRIERFEIEQVAVHFGWEFPR